MGTGQDRQGMPLHARSWWELGFHLISHQVCRTSATLFNSTSGAVLALLGPSDLHTLRAGVS